MKVVGPGSPILQKPEPVQHGANKAQIQRRNEQMKQHKADNHRSVKLDMMKDRFQEMRANNPEKFAEVGKSLIQSTLGRNNEAAEIPEGTYVRNEPTNSTIGEGSSPGSLVDLQG